MTATLIIPGLYGSGEGHWQRHWLRDHPDSVLVEQDDWDDPLVDRWADRLEETLLEHVEAYIVAHSLGCLLTAKFADRPSARRIKGALLVAPCDLRPTERRHPDAAIRFGPMPTRALPFPSITVGSLNDHYMELDRLTLYARLWKTELRNIGLAGHINIASGFGRWTGGYALFDNLREKAKAPRRYVADHTSHTSLG
ncbi:alpha/beta hydrolase [Rhizobium sp. 16-449-1b]|uniref:alpha/beta hydrolase n=1 Tax=Rhizobium sp. 16-449-1b TaxID=2819989 RepID=UPI001ADAFEC9|nr:alpha/beta hydrolase [Rhizobium sp. 16-449-1b]MBO9193996.1 alpha/beta hydrolase [Rhizobium sp. 16-449-1b]